MRVRIHRGTKEIGGTCIELRADGARLLLDLGLPLDGNPDDVGSHPVIEGLAGGDDLLGLVLSHGHVDHWGLAPLAGPDLPVALGAATLRILQAAAPFVPRPYVPARPVEFTSGTTLQFGPFRVTPHLVDHSAYDAHAIEVEAGGKRLFYSGDIRGHGRKAALFEKLVSDPPENVDVMLMEGSSFGRLDPDLSFPTESEVEQRLVELFGEAKGLALVAASAQNIDRMVSLYRACKRTGRTLIIDLYTAEMLRATDNTHIPQSNWPGVALYIPQYQRVQIKRSGRFDLLDHHATHRIFGEGLTEIAPNAAMLFRSAMLSDLDRAGCLSGAVAIWSQWSGYLAQERGRALMAELAQRDIPLVHAHTSGHASIKDLKRLARAVAPKMLVPVHTFAPQSFPEHFEAVALKQDGEWWEVAA
ncbi:metallo-beta-lactamase family protein [Nitrobacter sp. Nb-311A]|uniref:MBL fold metallo-hydrolase n=1 Tax=Nitrobacter sp. Nb-311A TaxID=314253 RepID=UPI0000686497|nr:MBL fold metallo-hydrolase [Nitrobacter sp. Nb-311A]EAQ37514.1 metallo-beta-lactamase family protein [Nitrobacter sp. Nb-311A]